MIWFKDLKLYAYQLKKEIFALYFASRDPRTPWHAKLVVIAVVAYAFSPIDLIPDFIPILGYLDDLILLPLGIALAIKLIPHSVLNDCRILAAESMKNEKPVNWIAAVIIVLIWIILMGLGILWIFEEFTVLPQL
ncbi:YkvA family protein [Nitrosomonas ureae]|uniref:Uncharacterized protein DUF1232 n=1 Tax=Nitrosomonas ureae TaxID=44577 RepID=A0A2T5I794_9PROT|nr:YkvA family protein [Nitrosomonas ureae]PTQ79690.1 uncharacterized protein DUF1232 [Nitrosomonas ureae]